VKKRRVSIDTTQLGFTFEPRPAATLDASLAGLDRMIAGAVAVALREDGRSRDEIAGAVSALCGTTVSKMMLDAYAAESRDEYNISAGRMLALIAATKRYDLLDAMVRPIGATVLIGEEIHAARLGHLQAQRDQLDAEIKKMRSQVQPIGRAVNA
jgi:hypothetical protein